MSYQVIKLSNGEDIVCQVHQSKSSAETNKLKISYPLRMETVTRSTKKGVVESLALSRWLQPYSDEEIFNVEKSSIVIMTPASSGLSKYYEYVLRGLEQVNIRAPSKKELDDIEKADIAEKETYVDDIIDSKELEELIDKLSNKRTIH
tara:strand:- start:57 stop:500 length:444 start_codon:yes stop_codon:yes gene_type:complete